MIRINYGRVQRKKIWGFILILIGLFCGLLTLGCFADDDTGFGIFFGVITLCTIGSGYGKIKAANNVDRYMYLVENENCSVENLARIMNRPETEIVEELEELINSGIIINYYLNKNTMCLEEITRIYDRNPKKVQETKQELIKKEIKVCEGCGASVDLSKGDFCEYCGRKLK